MAINLERACGNEFCTHPFNCKVAQCSTGESIRARSSIKFQCANNGGCSVETGQTKTCSAGDCDRSLLMSQGK